MPGLPLLSFLFFRLLFPDKKDGLCSCGCGIPINGKNRRWATDDCRKFADAIFAIIGGYSGDIRRILRHYACGYICEICEAKDSPENPIELDHIFPVKFGGGGGWLSNYMFKCRKCHREKTNSDFGWKQKTNNSQTKIRF